MDLTISFHRKDSSSLAFDCDHVRKEILCVHSGEGDRLLPALSDPERNPLL